MVNDLKVLQNKIDQLIQRYQSLQEELRQLKKDLAQKESDHRLMEKKLHMATFRLEALLNRFPVSEHSSPETLK